MLNGKNLSKNVDIVYKTTKNLIINSYELKYFFFNIVLREASPIGQLPYLTVDNKVRIAQSLAVARFVANRTNMVGENDLEQAKADAVVLTSFDIQTIYYARIHPFKKDEKAFAEIRRKFFEKEVPLFLDRFERLATMYGSKGYSVGNSLKWSDLSIYDTLSVWFFIDMDPKLLEAYPHVHEIYKTVDNHPRIKDYVARRPKDTPF